tara:strand:+ start:75 stop:1331 length:1257 start_codon:yes stop_codon:yes gene_type:complete
MKTTFFAFFIIVALSSFGQSFPFDFENNTPGMLGYDGATFTIVPNPNSTGNSSANVAEIVKVNVSDIWAGGKITNISSLDFSSAATSVLSMKVYTNEPVGTVIKVKLENPYTCEVDAVTTMSGAWETLTFDFGIPAPYGSVDLVIMPQPFTDGGGKVFYVDDIQQVPGVIATPRSGLPVTFESGTTDRHFFDFESAIMESLPNPLVGADNGSPNVGKVIKYLGAPYGGTSITFSNNVDFVNHPVITMKVLTSAPIGTYITLKAEKPFWGEERSVQTTKTEEWETLSFDFTNAPTDLPTFALMFDFVAGSANVGDGTIASTFYFDDIKYANVPLSIEENDRATAFIVRPNPSSDYWLVSNTIGLSFNVEVYDVKGQLVGHFESNQGLEVTIDASIYASGVYYAKVTSATGSETIRLIKR